MQLRKRRVQKHRKRGAPLNRPRFEPPAAGERMSFGLTFNDLFYTFFRDYPPKRSTA